MSNQIAPMSHQSDHYSQPIILGNPNPAQLDRFYGSSAEVFDSQAIVEALGDRTPETPLEVLADAIEADYRPVIWSMNKARQVAQMMMLGEGACLPYCELTHNKQGECRTWRPGEVR